MRERILDEAHAEFEELNSFYELMDDFEESQTMGRLYYSHWFHVGGYWNDRHLL